MFCSVLFEEVYFLFLHIKGFCLLQGLLFRDDKRGEGDMIKRHL